MERGVMNKITVSKIPKAAMPMVHLLQAEVERPKKLPTMIVELDTLRWYKFRLFSKNKYFCPMGFHPLAKVDQPSNPFNFIGLPKCVEHSTIAAFAGWWDSQQNPRAMYKIWPKKFSMKKRDEILHKIFSHAK